MNLAALLAVACGAVSVREALEGDGVLASAFDSRVRLKAPATVAALLALTSWQRLPGREAARSKARIFSASYVSDRVPTLLCAQPHFDGRSCGAFDLVLLFAHSRDLARRACSTSVHDGCAMTCGRCLGARHLPEPLRAFGRAGCLRAGNTTGLEAAMLRVRAAPRADTCGAPGYHDLLHNEVQFQATDDALAALAAALVGVGVVVVEEDANATRVRVRRARGFATFLGDLAAAPPPPVWTYAMRAADGPAANPPAEFYSRYRRAPLRQDFSLPRLPLASAAGYYRRGTWAPDGDCAASRFCALGRAACLKRGKRANPAALMHADALPVCDLCFARDDCACRCPDWLWAPSSVALASGPAARAEFNCGGERRPPAFPEYGFVEVAHQPEPHHSAMAGLWLYRATPNATGLFYDARRVVEFADVCDLAAFANATWYDAKNYESKRRLFAYAVPLLAGTFDTVAFTHHRDAHRDLRNRLYSELVALDGGRTTCPVSAHLRLGDDRRPCDCRTLVC